MRYSSQELTERMKLIIREIKHLPSDSKVYEPGRPPSMREVPYWNELLQQIESQGTLQGFLDRHIPEDFLLTNTVHFPSPEQDETAAQMVEKSNLLIRDGAGAGKTAAFIRGKLALEQILLGEKINTLVICPNFVMSSWEAKVNEYLKKGPRIISITSGNRHERIEEYKERIADGSVDLTLVSYDALFRHTPKMDSDEIEDEIRNFSGYNEGFSGEILTLVDRLLEPLKNSDKQFLLGLDESHNAKNWEAARTVGVRRLALAADRVVAMTGNPHPDNLISPKLSSS